ncbi:ABC transporter transmembrane domain-containing protein [Candidatus Pelagibacter bacterium]|nr:ABC transporter transmembrane domain-containing protein [Candidatus Pelagibacter bacterium]
MSNLQIFVRLWKEYTKSMKYKILLAIFYSLIVAGSTASIAWLLDPAIEKLFVERDQSLLIIIPALIILAFSMKGIFLYLSKTTMITVGENLKATITADMAKTLIIADSDYIDEKHTGKFISNLTFDTGLISNLISTTVLNLFKDSFTLISLLAVMFFQNWKLSLVAIIMIPLAAIASKSLGKRIGKVSS